MALGSGPDSFHVLRPRNVLIFMASFCLIVGWRMGNAGLLSLGLGAALLVIAAGAAASRLLRGVEAERLHPERAFQDDEMQVLVRARTGSIVPHFLIEMQDSFSPSGPHEIRSLFPGIWRRGRALAIGYRGECNRHRGLYVLGPLRLAASDPLGLFVREMPLGLFTNVVVYPQAAEVRSLDLLGEGTRPHVGMDTIRRAGQSEEFIGLREFRLGDPPRRVHWPSSAHHGRLLVKDFRDDRTTEVTILLDLGRLGVTGLGEHTTVEYAIRAAAALARQAFERGHAIQLFAFGERIEHLPMGGGLQHLLTLLDRLAFLRAGGEHDFAREAAGLRPFFRRGATVALIFSATTLNFDSLAPLIENLIEDQIRVTALLIDDRSFPKLYREQEQSHVEAVSLDEAVMNLRLIGARVHVLTRRANPAEAIRTGLGIEAVGRDPGAPEAAEAAEAAAGEARADSFRGPGSAQPQPKNGGRR